MKRSNNLLTKSLQRLSSGKRIVSPSDDAGGLAVGMKLQSSLKRSAASRLNTQNGVSFLQMQDGVLKVAGEILDRMAELKSFWNDISKSNDDRETYNHEFNELQMELSTLKGQKFNGVSLFAMIEPDNNPLKIITSDDGLGEKIEMSRTGLFENLKSKFGADSVLNTGSNGSYRQLVGDFTRDGGLEDADPGMTSRAYDSGSVVYKNGPTTSESGYFMALNAVGSGTKIEDTGSSTSHWIRLADAAGNGFAESYPLSPEYDHTTIKYNAKGDRVAYLKGDVVKVPAHWASPGSFFFLEAQADVPRGLDIESLYAAGHVGPSGYFDYVGSDRSNGATADDKPLTEYLRTNEMLPQPVSLAQVGVQSATSAQVIRDLRDKMISGAPNGYNPGVVQVNSSIYVPSGDWGINLYSSLATFKEGSVILDNTNVASPRLLEFNHLVKGQYHGGAYDQGSYVNAGGTWLQAIAATDTNVSMSAIPRDPATLKTFATDSNAGTAGNAVTTANNRVRVAANIMKGVYDPNKAYASGDVVKDSTNAYYSLSATHHGKYVSGMSIDAGGTVYVSGVLHQNPGATATTTFGNLTQVAPAAGFTNPDAGLLTQAGSSANIVTNGVTADATGATFGGVNVTNTYYMENAWQKWDPAGTTKIGDPVVGGSTAYVDRTNDYIDVSNSANWVKTHYSHLNGKTVGTSYTRGDNIYHQGKNYVYTSHLDSHDAYYTDPANEGYTEFSELLRKGAVRELPMYVDTRGGGGGSGLPDDIYFRPNQDLKFMDRLPDGSVRTANMARRTDAPLPPGDEIFNSSDDAFYGGLQPGNDGIYGTLDDYYASTADLNIAQQSAHVDADADNNKDLLNGSNNLEHFSVADFVDFIQTLANVRAVNGGTMSRLNYAERILEENEINLGAAASRIMDTDMAYESTKMARQNVLLQAAASMVTQANALNNVVLSLLQ